MKKLSIYFAGTIAKNHEILESKWTEEDFSFYKESLDLILFFF